MSWAEDEVIETTLGISGRMGVSSRIQQATEEFLEF